ncbi:hypothetical protein [Actinomadura rupiterrae]|uniref:hypothetical protein n=1 Tax=Actinomadura rupiterrae TaxID=559627 RepID=UPI0020A395A0|nr:hypothetical protein [Actinomadura rupiterrae]MCP2339221.1 hypothetical protein [Actinomadura rupiterrae]
MDRLPNNQHDALALTSASLTAALASDWHRAMRLLQQVGDECGPDGVDRALLALCDTAIHVSGIVPGTPVAISWQAVDGDGAITGPDEVTRPEVVWAGRMLAARAADDEEQWDALLAAAPEDEIAFGRHAGALLEMSALIIAREKGVKIGER